MAKEKSKPVSCNNCNGTGTVFVTVEGRKQAITCGVCKGLGVV